MNLQQIIDLQADFGQAMPNYRGVPSVKERTQQINRALNALGRLLKIYDPQVALNVRSGVAVYDVQNVRDVGKRLWRVDEAYLGGVALLGPNWDAPKIWSLNELTKLNRNWRLDPAGASNKAVQYDAGHVMLHPTPDAATAAKSPNGLGGLVLPGVWLGNGGYSPAGFPTDDAADTGGTTTATVTSTFGTVAALRTTTGYTLTGLANTAAADAAVMTIGDTLPYVAEGGPTMAGARGLVLAVPSGATVNWVRVENLKMGSGTLAGVLLQLVADASDPDSPPLASWSQNATGAALAEYGPGPNWTGISAAQVAMPNFGLLIQLALPTGPGPIGGSYTTSVDYLRLSVNYTVDAGAAGAPATVLDLTAEPDLPSEGHEILAYVGAYLAAEPFASLEQVAAQLQAFNARWGAWAQQIAAQNDLALSPVDDDPEPVWGVRWGR